MRNRHFARTRRRHVLLAWAPRDEIELQESGSDSGFRPLNCSSQTVDHTTKEAGGPVPQLLCINGHEVPTEAAFCTQCGVSIAGLTQSSPQVNSCAYGHVMPEGVPYCTDCGAAVAPREMAGVHSQADTSSYPPPPSSPSAPPPASPPPRPQRSGSSSTVWIVLALLAVGFIAFLVILGSIGSVVSNEQQRQNECFENRQPFDPPC